MRNIIIGLLLGVALTFSISALAGNDPKISGPSGVLKGVEVLDNDGRRVCDDPYYYEAAKAVSCA